MLSYMVPSPIEDKPPLVPAISNKNSLQLVLLENHINKNGGIPSSLHQTTDTSATDTLTNGCTITFHKKMMKHTNSNMSITEASIASSNSSLNSANDIPAVHNGTGVNSSTPSAEKPPPKSRIANGVGKQTTLKRVSFGSSKGSMVETLIYETPVQEEPEPVHHPLSQRIILENTDDTDSYSTFEGIKVPSSKVRVSFFESSDKKYIISAPDSFGNNNCSDDFVIYEQFIMSSPAVQSNNTSTLQYSYDRQESTDSGWDNPFRPDGDLSKEADEIVELIREGKPITPTGGNSKLIEENGANQISISSQNCSSGTSKANGNVEKKLVTGVEVQRGTIVTPTEASQVEHVVIKKKPKCKCCVIQ